MKYSPAILLLLILVIIPVKYIFLKRKIHEEINNVFDTHKIVSSIKKDSEGYYVITIVKSTEDRYTYTFVAFNNCINEGESDYCISPNSTIYSTILDKCVDYWQQQCNGYYKVDFDILLEFHYENDYFYTKRSFQPVEKELAFPKLNYENFRVHQTRGVEDIRIKLSITSLIKDIAIGLILILVAFIITKYYKKLHKKS